MKGVIKTNLYYGCVTLRSIELKDKGLLKDLMNSPEVENLTVGWNLPVSERSQELWIMDHKNTTDCIRWMIELDNGTTLGMIILNELDWKNRTAFLSYKSNPFEKNRIKGDMKDAIYAVLSYAFNEMGMHRIEASILDYNIFSIKLIKSMGFMEEGVWRKKIFKRGAWHDEIVFGLLCDEFTYYEDNAAPWKKITSHECDL